MVCSSVPLIATMMIPNRAVLMPMRAVGGTDNDIFYCLMVPGKITKLLMCGIVRTIMDVGDKNGDENPILDIMAKPLSL